MKKLFTLAAAALFAGSMMAQTTWDFSDLATAKFIENTTTSYLATDGSTEMRYTAGGSDAIVAKDGTKSGYLKENGSTASKDAAKDLDGETVVGKTRLIRLFVSGNGRLTINCTNAGKFKVFDGSASGTKLIDALDASTASAAINVTTAPIWIETTAKGYITSIVWSPVTTHTVTYKANGGTGDDVVDGDATDVAECTFIAPEGLAFSSWNTEADGSGTAYAVGAAINSDLTLYAQWVEIYDVTFNLQGRGEDIDPQKVAKGAKVSEPNKPESESYLFLGWFKEAACENAWDFANDVVENDTELFAKWVVFEVGATLAPYNSSEATLAVNDLVPLSDASNGGIITVVGKNGDNSIKVSTNGLQLSGGTKDSVLVTLNKFLTAGSVIQLNMRAGGTGSRGLNILNKDLQNVFTGTWKAEVNGEENSLSYVVTETDGLKGKKSFYLQRNNSIYLKSVVVANIVEKDPTAIDNTEVGEKAVKVVENGQLIIIKNGVKYNAQGTIVK